MNENILLLPDSGKEQTSPCTLSIDINEEGIEPDKKLVRSAQSSINALALSSFAFPAPRQIVKELIVPGVTLLVGASKIGKSWLVLDMCLSIALGKSFLDRETQRCRVWYFALEDSAYRMKTRLMRISGGAVNGDAASLTFIFESPTIDEGFLERLTGAFDKNIKEGNAALNPSVIVIDTLQVIRGISSGGVNAYAADYRFMRLLKGFAGRYGVAVVLVHHTNKLRQTDDPYEKVSGSTGLMGAADTTLLLDRPRGGNDAVLSGVGRDISFDDMPLVFENGVWRVDRIRDKTAAEDVTSPLGITLCLASSASDKESVFISYASIMNGIRENGGTPPATARTLVSEITAFMSCHGESLALKAECGARSKNGIRGVRLVKQGLKGEQVSLSEGA